MYCSAVSWLATFTPFFTDRERREAICQHRLFFSQAEYCDNLIFSRRAALDFNQTGWWRICPQLSKRS